MKRQPFSKEERKKHRYKENEEKKNIYIYIYIKVYTKNIIIFLRVSICSAGYALLYKYILYNMEKL